MNVCSLYDISVGETARVDCLLTTSNIRRRLLDMGFTTGTSITCVLQNPSGASKAYYVRGAVIALRKEDASCIQVTAG